MPVTHTLPADMETPVTAYLKLHAAGARFLLESVEHGERLGRYSFIACPGREIVLRPGPDPLAAVLRHTRRDSHPLLGGAVGYLGYDFARCLEKIPDRLPDPLGLPMGRFAVVEDLVVFDHIGRRMTLIARDRRRLRELEAALEQPAPRAVRGHQPRFRVSPRAAFERGVRRAQRHILAGDAIQIVLSHRAECAVTAPPFQIYRALRILNPSPYMIYFDFDDFQFVGASPEIHVKLEDGAATLRPIAGTRPRGETPEADRALADELLADPKERAEHLMLIDLARNDLGRVCETGSVRVGDLYTIERYSTVQHIVSEVTGRLRRGVSASELIGATFPAGTVTGAPKIRAMEIIEHLERVRRGPYAGAAGYVGRDAMDLCITIRTAIVRGGTAYLQAGAGIVADSDPRREWDETIDKMAPLRNAIELAERGL